MSNGKIPKIKCRKVNMSKEKKCRKRKISKVCASDYKKKTYRRTFIIKDFLFYDEKAWERGWGEGVSDIWSRLSFRAATWITTINAVFWFSCVDCSDRVATLLTFTLTPSPHPQASFTDKSVVVFIINLHQFLLFTEYCIKFMLTRYIYLFNCLWIAFCPFWWSVT